MAVATGYALSVLSYTLCLVVLLAVSVAVGFSLYLLYQQRKYAHIPSPKGSTFFMGHIGLIREILAKEKAFSYVAYKWYTECGQVYCFRLMHKNVVMCLDTIALKTVLTDSKHVKPSSVYHKFWALFGNRFTGRSLVSETDHALWAPRRALFNPAFHRKYLLGLIDVFNDEADRLVNNLKEKADGHTPVCMEDSFKAITMDIIGRVGFGLELNGLEDPHCTFVGAASTCLQALQLSLFKPWDSWIRTKERREYEKKVGEACRLVRGKGRDCIKERLAARARGEDLPKDILTNILKKSDDLKEGLGIEEMIDEFVTFFIAGFETTGGHLAFTLQQICRYPDTLKKILKEIEDVLGEKPDVEVQDLSKLEYLMLVMKESMRQFPPVSGTSRVLAHDVVSLGYKIPKGTEVRFNAHVMGRLECFFDDPEEFRPERFKLSDEKPRHLYAYFPFSIGQRNCIGQSMAMIETRVILAKLLRRFRFELVPGQTFKIQTHLTNSTVDGCKMYVSLR